MRVVMDDVARWTEARGLGAAEPLRAWAEDVADGNIRARRRCRQAPRAVGAGQARPHGPDMVGASAELVAACSERPKVNCEEKRGISISAKFWDRVGQSRTEPDSATAGWSGFNLELCWLGLGELLQAVRVYLALELS
nr:uncharacterized protein LOC127341678 [Lolium perenne]